jgi:hypothetical protein
MRIHRNNQAAPAATSHDIAAGSLHEYVMKIDRATNATNFLREMELTGSREA